MKIYIQLKNSSGKLVKLGSNDKIFIDIMIGNTLFESLTVKHEKNIVEPMGTNQSLDGFTLTNESGKRISYMLDKRQN